MKSLVEIVNNLSSFWSSKGLYQLFSYDIEKGASTCNPEVIHQIISTRLDFFVLDKCRRAKDALLSSSNDRCYTHHQFEVILNTKNRSNLLDLYEESLVYLGIELEKSLLEYLKNDWEHATLQAYGKGWEVTLNGLEITQVTYFRQIAGKNVDNVIEFAYGIERIAMVLNNTLDIKQLTWDKNLSYSSLNLGRESEMENLNQSLIDSKTREKFIDALYSEIDILKNKIGILISTGRTYMALESLNRISENINQLDLVNALDETRKKKIILEIKSLVDSLSKKL